MKRSGKLIAVNDPIIEKIINDPHYDIRPDGTIWSTICSTGKVSVDGIWRQLCRLREGYVEINYFHQGYRAALRAHRIVYRKFVGPLSEDLVINHKNGNRSDNRPENLELDTQGHNNEHRYRVLGREAVIGNKKISDEIADEIRNDHANGLSYNKLCEKYGLVKSSISYIINRKTWDRKVQSTHTFAYKTKLNMDLAKEIRQLYRDGESQRILAKKYSVGLTAIKNVCANRTWIE